MEKFTNQQNEFYNQMARLHKNYKKFISRVTKEYIETRLELLESYWERFQETHLDILKVATDEEMKSHDYFTEDVFGQGEEEFLDCKTIMKERLAELNPSKSANKNDGENGHSGPSSGNKIKLPSISIPSFSGNYRDWPSFNDLYQSLIHKNPDLSNIQKFHYLKSNLTGEAEVLLKQFPLTDANYEKAFELLESRYNNKRLIVNAHLIRLFNQKKLTSESAKGMRELLDTTTECLSALDCIGIATGGWDPIIIYLIVGKFDNESHRQWEHELGASREVPSLDQLTEFMEIRFRSLEAMTTMRPRESNTPRVASIKTFQTNADPICDYCSQDHYIYHCKEFGKITPEKRREVVREKQLCYNCLVPRHSVKACRQTSTCKICKRRHHTLLHTTPPVIVHQTNQEHEKQEETPEISSHKAEIIGSQVLLATALVRVTASNGERYTLRALIDQGSQASFITTSAVQKLGLKKVPIYSKVTGVNSTMSTVSKGLVEFQLCSHFHDTPVTKVKAHILKSISSILPRKEVNIQLGPTMKGIIFADPNFMQPSSFDILLGAEIYAQIILDGLKRDGSVIAQNSQLGWLISGEVSGNNTEHTNVLLMHNQLEIDNLVRRFWESEELYTETRSRTASETECEKIFEETHSRTSSGRYQVSLPFSPENITPLGESRVRAVKRLLQMEKRFQKDSKFRERYTCFMQEYLELGHMERVPTEELNKTDSQVFYLPHHGVLREESTTTKLRVVFNGSETTGSGTSLNDHLLIGPALQSDIRDLFLRWRSYPICLLADIQRMYRQILVREEDRDFQRIVWRSDPKVDMVDYRLCTVTYGTSCAPYLAIKVLSQLAKDECECSPTATSVLKKDFYMDDLLSGCETEEDAIELCNDLIKLLDKGGFVLHKWASNSMNVLDSNPDGSSQQRESLEIVMDKSIKALGVKWSPKTDCFELKISMPNPSTHTTKRNVLADIAKIYDPLGWLCPIVILAKIFLQKLWLLGVGWDDMLPDNYKKEWLDLLSQLTNMSTSYLPRWIGMSKSNQRVELHGFSDASNLAYAAVVYVRIITQNCKVLVTMLTAKTKVAPVKSISLPRLELCGAVLLCKLLQRVKVCLNVSAENVFAWTDSTIVLAWLQKHPSSWKTFVANRVTEILNVTHARQWHHVSSKDNPADCASRGLSPAQLESQELWWKGPIWLSAPNLTIAENHTVPDTILEIKAVHNLNCNEISMENEFVLSKFWNLMKLTRVLAYCFRFYELCKQKLHAKTINPIGTFTNLFPNFVTTDELKRALNVCVKISQRFYFSKEIVDLMNGRHVDKKSSLYSLHPFVDDSHILRVGGRLYNAPLPHDTKHPIILSGKSHLAYLIVDQIHQRTLHGGPLLMLNVIRCTYWITKVKLLVKSHVRRCVKCVRQAPQLVSQLMGNLPSCRVTVAKPFSNSGVDFAGPVFLKSSKLRTARTVKAYIALFICTATKAIHLELVSELTTSAFIAAFKRFTSRRGHCSHLYSDCGSNFIGASAELVRLINQTTSALPTEISELLASDGTVWHFIPPGSPHFGGLWEAGVRSLKHHLKRDLGDNKLTFEEYATLLAQIECCLNSRPISAMSDSADDLSALTPGHFLVFGPPIIVPNENLLDVPINRLNRWQHIERILQSFWQRWKQEYLTNLQHRYKWASLQNPVKINDLVLVKDDRLPPSKWLMGRVLETYPGPDGIV